MALNARTLRKPLKRFNAAFQDNINIVGWTSVYEASPKVECTRVEECARIEKGRFITKLVVYRFPVKLMM